MLQQRIKLMMWRTAGDLLADSYNIGIDGRITFLSY
jgi:hypothetical protein